MLLVLLGAGLLAPGVDAQVTTVIRGVVVDALLTALPLSVQSEPGGGRDSSPPTRD